MGSLSVIGFLLLAAIAAAIAIALFLLLTRVVEFVVIGALLVVAIGSGDSLFILVTVAVMLLAIAFRIHANRVRRSRR